MQKRTNKIYNNVNRSPCFTQLSTNINETLIVNYKDRITKQNAKFHNFANEYWGQISAINSLISSSILDNVTITNSKLEDIKSINGLDFSKIPSKISSLTETNKILSTNQNEISNQLIVLNNNVNKTNHYTIFNEEEQKKFNETYPYKLKDFYINKLDNIKNFENFIISSENKANSNLSIFLGYLKNNKQTLYSFNLNENKDLNFIFPNNFISASFEENTKKFKINSKIGIPLIFEKNNENNLSIFPAKKLEFENIFKLYNNGLKGCILKNNDINNFDNIKNEISTNNIVLYFNDQNLVSSNNIQISNINSSNFSDFNIEVENNILKINTDFKNISAFVLNSNLNENPTIENYDFGYILEKKHLNVEEKNLKFDSSNNLCSNFEIQLKNKNNKKFFELSKNEYNNYISLIDNDFYPIENNNLSNFLYLKNNKNNKQQIQIIQSPKNEKKFIAEYYFNTEDNLNDKNLITFNIIPLNQKNINSNFKFYELFNENKFTDIKIDLKNIQNICNLSCFFDEKSSIFTLKLINNEYYSYTENNLLITDKELNQKILYNFDFKLEKTKKLKLKIETEIDNKNISKTFSSTILDADIKDEIFNEIPNFKTFENFKILEKSQEFEINKIFEKNSKNLIIIKIPSLIQNYLIENKVFKIQNPLKFEIKSNDKNLLHFEFPSNNLSSNTNNQIMKNCIAQEFNLLFVPKIENSNIKNISNNLKNTNLFFMDSNFEKIKYTYLDTLNHKYSSIISENIPINLTELNNLEIKQIMIDKNNQNIYQIDNLNIQYSTIIKTWN